MKGLTDLVGTRVTVFNRPEWGPDLMWTRWITGRVRAVAMYPGASSHDSSTFHFLVQLEEDHTAGDVPYNMIGALMHVTLSVNTTLVPEAT